MAYPFLPVTPSCGSVVINDVCGCSSVVTNSGCNNNDSCSTTLTASSTIVYNGPVLSCIIAEPCDTLNVILQKIDQIICNLLSQINTLTTQINNINTEITIINGDIININNQLAVCCTTTTTTTLNPSTLIYTTNTFVHCGTVNVCPGPACADAPFYLVWMTNECKKYWPSIGCEIWLDEQKTIPFPDGGYNNGSGDCIVITGGIITNIP